MVLSPMSNRASPSLATLKSSCASADVGLIDGTAELATEVGCDDRTHEDLIGMLTEPTHCGLWITWRGLQCEAALVANMASYAISSSLILVIMTT
jgi:hypothetical protein